MKISNKSTWESFYVPQKFGKLKENTSTDAVIIGGGMVGILTAYLLAKEGISVVILEKDRILTGATMFTTAFLTQNYDTDIVDSIKIYGKKKTKQIWDSHGNAIDLIEKIIKQEKIECEFMWCSNYSYGNVEEDVDLLKEEYDAMKKVSISNVSFTKTNKILPGKFGLLETKRQAKFNPMKFLLALVPRLEEMGVRIYEKTEVQKISGTKPVKAHVGQLVAEGTKVITATYDPLNNPKETFAKKGMYVSYVFEVQIPKGTFPEGIYEDLENPYHYFRIDKGGKFDRMIIGGEDNRKEIEFRAQKNFNALEDYLTGLMGKSKYQIVRKWRGPILEPSDGLPLIGEFKSNQLLAAAFSGNGMTYSAISAMMFRDAILKKKNPWFKLFDPTRTPSAKQLFYKARDYGEEFIKGAVRNTFKY